MCWYMLLCRFGNQRYINGIAFNFVSGQRIESCYSFGFAAGRWSDCRCGVERERGIRSNTFRGNDTDPVPTGSRQARQAAVQAYPDQTLALVPACGR